MSSLPSIECLSNLDKHLKRWDPPNDFLLIMNETDKFLIAAQLERWEDGRTHLCEDDGLQAAVTLLIPPIPASKAIYHSLS